MKEKNDLIYNIQKDELLFILAGKGLKSFYCFENPRSIVFPSEGEGKKYSNQILFNLYQKDYIVADGNKIGLTEDFSEMIDVLISSKQCIQISGLEDLRYKCLFYPSDGKVILVRTLLTRRDALEMKLLSQEDFFSMFYDLGILHSNRYDYKDSHTIKENDDIKYLIELLETHTGKKLADITLVENRITDYMIINRGFMKERVIYNESQLKAILLTYLGKL